MLEKNMMKNSQLQATADQILRKAGYRTDGRKRGSVSRDQWLFEAKLISTPCGGQAKARKSK